MSVVRSKMLIATGKKEKLSVSKGSLIEVAAHHEGYSTNQAWYCAILEEDLGKSKQKKLEVRFLDPQDNSPQSMAIIVQRLIRPVPPLDLFGDVDFEVGDIIDAVYNGRWCTGVVIRVLGNGHFLVNLKSDPGAMKFERRDMRLHLVWEDNQWFRCEKEQMVEPDFSVGKYIEVRTEVDNLGDFWTPAKVIKENEDGTLMVKLNSLFDEEDISTKISVPYSNIRPPQPIFGYRQFKLKEKVDTYINYRYCPGVVSEVLSEDKYVVVLPWTNNESKEFRFCDLRHSLQWNDGIWVKEENVTGQSVENTTKHVDVVETPPTELQLNRLQLDLNEQAKIEEHSDYVVASDEIGEESGTKNEGRTSVKGSNAMNEAQGSVKCREGYEFEFDLNVSLFPSQDI